MGELHIRVIDDIGTISLFYASFVVVNGAFIDAWKSTRSLSPTIIGKTLPTDIHYEKIKLIRQGDVFESYYLDAFPGEWTWLNTQTIHLKDPVYAGLSVFSFVNGALTTAYLSEVELTQQQTSNVAEWELYQ